MIFCVHVLYVEHTPSSPNAVCAFMRMPQYLSYACEVLSMGHFLPPPSFPISLCMEVDEHEHLNTGVMENCMVTKFIVFLMLQAKQVFQEVLCF